MFTLRPLYSPLKEPPILTEEAARWASELVWTSCARETPALPVSDCRDFFRERMTGCSLSVFLSVV